MYLPLDQSGIPTLKLNKTPKEYVEDLIKKITIVQKYAKENMEKAQNISKQYYDKKSREPRFRVGDHVQLKVQQITPGKKKELHPKWTGPYYIVHEGQNNTCKKPSFNISNPLKQAYYENISRSHKRKRPR